MITASTIVRPATAHDAASLAALAEQTFRDAFAAANSAADIALHCAARYNKALQHRDIVDPELTIYLAVQCGIQGRDRGDDQGRDPDGDQKDELLGFIQLRQSDCPSCVLAQQPLEIQQLYVASTWHGTGVAHDLMAVALNTAISRAADFIWLGVWEDNPRAISFYQKYGFVAVGAQTFMLGTDSQRDLVMRRPLKLV
ncbi:MAG: ribosomal protein S18 acetylase RimI-like enzyme [Candidatus Azotimanducaceae bacterium]